jgi:tight adherence protein C
MPALIALGFAVAIALGAYALLTQAEERSTVRSSLRQLEDHQVANLRERALLNPITDRVLSPISTGLTALARRFLPIGQVEASGRKLIHAGMGGQERLDRFLAARVVGAALIPVWFLAFVVVGVGPVSGGLASLAEFALLSAVGIFGPDSWLNRKVQDRQHAIQVRLPDVMDLLTISVEAGLGFDQAVDRTISAVPGPISEEFGRMLGAMRAGASRPEALRALEERTNLPEIRSFVLALLQADTFGVSIGRVLRAQSDEMRVKRRQLAQERAQKAPVKMLVPMVFCIFPALFVVVIGPAVINISHNLHLGK